MANALNKDDYTIWNNEQISNYAKHREDQININEHEEWHQLRQVVRTDYHDLADYPPINNLSLFKICHKYHVPLKKHPFFHRNNQLSKQDYQSVSKYIDLNIKVSNVLIQHDDSEIQKDLLQLNGIFAESKLSSMPKKITMKMANDAKSLSYKYAIRASTPKIYAQATYVKSGLLNKYIDDLKNKYHVKSPIQIMYFVQDSNVDQVRQMRSDRNLMTHIVNNVMRDNKQAVLKYVEQYSAPTTLAPFISRLWGDLDTHQSYEKICLDTDPLKIGTDQKTQYKWNRYITKIGKESAPKKTYLQKRTQDTIQSLKQQFKQANDMHHENNLNDQIPSSCSVTNHSTKKSNQANHSRQNIAIKHSQDTEK